MRTLIRLEILRIMRNRRYLFFTIIYPVVLFEIMRGSYKGVVIPGFDAKTYFMVSMATFGTVGAALNTAMRISTERKTGWVRQLRLSALPSWGYVTAKIAAAAAATLPAILAVFILGAAQGVHLSALTWIGLVLALWVGAFVFSALGVAIGYMAPPDGVQPIVMIFYIGMAFLGGTWFAISGTFGKIAGWTPIALYNELGRTVELGGSVNVGHMIALAAYLVAFIGLAASLYRRDKQAA